MNKIRIALVEYLNTLPFSEGLRLSGLDQRMEIHRVNPAECAAMFREGKVDISLCPVGALENMPDHKVIGNYCIGADGDVGTVVLLSNESIDRIKKVKLDRHSNTSNKLIQILADRYWQQEWKYYFDDNEMHPESCVMIGDKVFEQRKKFPFQYDLAGAWKEMTSLSMVFAVWIATPGIDAEIVNELDAACKQGLDFIKSDQADIPAWQKKYLLKNISYDFDAQKKRAMQLYLQYAESLHLQAIPNH